MQLPQAQRIKCAVASLGCLAPHCSRGEGQGTVIMGHPVPPSENPGLAFGGRQRARILTKTHEALGGKDEEEARPTLGWGGEVGSRALGGLILTPLWWALEWAGGRTQEL